MMLADNNSVHFSNYLSLLKGFCPLVRGMVVFDTQLEAIWQEGMSAPDQDAMQAFRRSGNDRLIVSVEGNQAVELSNLKNEHKEVLLTLCYGLEVDKETSTQSVAELEYTALLDELLLADYEQCMALATKEDELNHMTDELTRRYEELNLIYKAEDQAMNIYHGRELLRQLVINTSRFLNVDIIYLHIAGKNVAMHKFKNDKPVFQAEALFDCLRGPMLPVLEAQGRAIVVNHVDDARQFGVEDEIPFKLIVSPIVDAENQVIGSLSIASQNFMVDFSNSDRNLLDVMAKKASKIAQSHFDPLTGLENSNSFELILKDLLKQTWGTNVTHAIANIDIDRMAVINDISGRDAGDYLIKQVGQTLAGIVRSRDVVARIGSDKFGVLLENCDLDIARKVMTKIAHAVSSIEMEWDGKTHEVSVSIGVAPISAEAQSVTSLLNAAETARNVSKERGRNTIHVLEMEDSDLLQRKEQIQWVSRIQSALRGDRFVLYAQEIEALKPGAKKPHYEILLRMLDDDDSIIVPGKFIAAAENFYLMSSIDYWVVDRAFDELAQINRDTKNRIEVSINLSGQSLSDAPGFAIYIENKLEEYRLDATDICFEITESAAIQNIDDARAFIDQVHALGCKFSLDDFGTGLSSFAYLKNLQVDYLKIDGGFVRDILKDPVSESMVAAINQVGQAMDLKTVAEFVENDAIRQKLTRIGVDYGQGYAIGKPSLFREICSQAAKSA